MGNNNSTIENNESLMDQLLGRNLGNKNIPEKYMNYPESDDDNYVTDFIEFPQQIYDYVDNERSEALGEIEFITSKHICKQGCTCEKQLSVIYGQFGGKKSKKFETSSEDLNDFGQIISSDDENENSTSLTYNLVSRIFNSDTESEDDIDAMIMSEIEKRDHDKQSFNQSRNKTSFSRATFDSEENIIKAMGNKNNKNKKYI